MGRITQTTKVIAEGGHDKIFRQTFDVLPEEKLNKLRDIRFILAGFLKDRKPIKLTKGQEIIVTTDYDIKGNENMIAMSYKKL